eukprot:Seg1838.8 transcript_id=Seg1838.8/GoldUCD/mRNA.D3Y31 product="hypothetical protein" protein_id=Seg1838.8/GoldUCD/D3Y31
MANAKIDQKHLSDLKEEEKFLLRMQFKLQRQQKLLKVEEAALLKLMSGNANGPNAKGSKFPLSTTSLPAAQGTTISGQVQMNDNNFLQDTAVNTAPLRLDNFTVQATQNSLEVDDVQGSDLAVQVNMDSLGGNECLTSPMEEEDENISEHDDDDDE